MLTQCDDVRVDCLVVKGKIMSATSAIDMPPSVNEEILPPEVSARSESWLTRARNYPVFSRTWYRYRARAWMGTLIPALLLIFLIDAARGADWRTFFVVWIPLSLAGTAMHLGGAALAVWVRQRGYAEKRMALSDHGLMCRIIVQSVAIFCSEAGDTAIIALRGTDADRAEIALFWFAGFLQKQPRPRLRETGYLNSKPDLSRAFRMANKTARHVRLISQARISGKVFISVWCCLPSVFTSAAVTISGCFLASAIC
jgi:hypothetical protein